MLLERKEEFDVHQFVVSEIAYRLSFISEKIKGAEVFIDPKKEADIGKTWMIELSY